MDKIYLDELLDKSINSKHLENTPEVQEIQRQQRARTLVVPTDDTVVIKCLNELKDKLTPSDGPHERRERLKYLMSLGYMPPILQTHMKEPEDMDGAPELDDLSEFYFTGTNSELPKYRLLIAEDAAVRSKQRLALQKQIAVRNVAEVANERRDKYTKLKGTRLVASELGGYLEDQRPLSACALLGDSEELTAVIGTNGGSLALWSVPNCTLLTGVEGSSTGHNNRICSIEGFGTTNIISSDIEGKIHMWRYDDSEMQSNLKHVVEFKGHASRVSTLSISPCNRFLASGSHDYSWRLWDIERATEVSLQEGHSKEILSVSFHPDGALLATCGLDAIIRIWDLRSGSAIWTPTVGHGTGSQVVTGHTQGIISGDFSPNGFELATAGQDGLLCTWDLRALRLSQAVPAHSSIITSVRYSGDGSALVTSSFDGTVKLWGGYDAQPLAELRGHDGKVMAADLNATGDLIVSVGVDRTFKIWTA